MTRLLLGMALFLGTCGGAFAASRVPIPVVVSILPQKYFVRQVGGDRVRISVMVPPGRSPETYEPSPRQLVALSGARLYFRIGVPFEHVWMSRMRSVNPGMTVVDTRAGIVLRPMPGAGTRSADTALGRPDPHIWMDPRLVERQVQTIRTALIAADPSGRAVYQRNARHFTRRLETLDRRLRGILAPLSPRSIIVLHPAFGYFAAAYGLRQIPIETEGKEPGARSLDEIIRTGRHLGVRVVLVEPQYSTRAAKVVARAVGARVVRANPLAEDYPANLVAIAKAIVAASSR